MSDSTCWAFIDAARGGDPRERERFATLWQPLARAYLAARWRGTSHLDSLEDAVQELFLEFFRPDGILARADRERAGGFRAFLYGALRKVALRFEERRARRPEQLDSSAQEGIADDDPTLSQVFDRAWARTLLRAAFTVLEERAAAAPLAGDADAADPKFSAVQRVELLRLHYREGRRISEIASDWRADAKALHHQLDRAKREYRAALAEAIAFHSPGTVSDLPRRIQELLAVLR